MPLLEAHFLRPILEVAIAHAGGSEALARKTGVTSRSIRRIQHGHTRYVRVNVADRILMQLGLHVTDVWPGMFPEK